MLCTFLLAALVGMGGPTLSAPPDDSRIEQIELDTVHPLFGGIAVYIQRTGDVWVRVIDRGIERRYRTTATVDELRRLEQVFTHYGFDRMRTRSWSSIPDSMPDILTVWYSSGRIRSHAQLPTSPNTRFDPLRAFVLRFATRARVGDALYDGPRDFEWWPAGFLKHQRSDGPQAPQRHDAAQLAVAPEPAQRRQSSSVTAVARAR
jgi:hypothetical protein